MLQALQQLQEERAQRVRMQRRHTMFAHASLAAPSTTSTDLDAQPHLCFSSTVRDSTPAAQSRASDASASSQHSTCEHASAAAGDTLDGVSSDGDAAVALVARASSALPSAQSSQVTSGDAAAAVAPDPALDTADGSVGMATLVDDLRDQVQCFSLSSDRYLLAFSPIGFKNSTGKHRNSGMPACAYPHQHISFE